MALSFRKQWEATDVGPHGPCPRVVSLLRTGVGMSGKFPSKWLVPFPTPLWVTVTPLSARALWVGAESGTGTLRNDSTETKTLLRNLSLKPQGLLSLLRAERKGVLEKKASKVRLETGVPSSEVGVGRVLIHVTWIQSPTADSGAWVKGRHHCPLQFHEAPWEPPARVLLPSPRPPPCHRLLLTLPLLSVQSLLPQSSPAAS